MNRPTCLALWLSLSAPALPQELDFVEVRDGDGELRYSLGFAKERVPPFLDITNVHAFLEGRFGLDADGRWLRHPTKSELTAAPLEPDCLTFDEPSIAAADPPQSSTSLTALLHDEGKTATLLTSMSTATERWLVSRRSIEHTGDWGPPVVAAAPQNGTFSFLDATVAPNGEVTVVYREFISGTGFEVWAARHAVGTGWSAPELLHLGTDLIQTADLTTTAENDVILAFQEGPPPAEQAVFAIRYDRSEDTWSAPVQVSPPGAGALNCTLRSSLDRDEHWLLYVDIGAQPGIMASRWDDAAAAFGPVAMLPESSNFSFGLLSFRPSSSRPRWSRPERRPSSGPASRRTTRGRSMPRARRTACGSPPPRS